MKKLTLISSAILALSSCTEKIEINQYPTQMVSSNEHVCVCKYLFKKTASDQNVRTKNGLILMKPNIKLY